MPFVILLPLYKKASVRKHARNTPGKNTVVPKNKLKIIFFFLSYRVHPTRRKKTEQIQNSKSKSSLP